MRLFRCIRAERMENLIWWYAFTSVWPEDATSLEVKSAKEIKDFFIGSYVTISQITGGK